MADMSITIDMAQVQRVFAAAPQAAVRRLGQLVQAGAIDVQREMRINAPVGAGGELRRSVIYRMRGPLEAEILPDSPYAPFVENGTRPHWTSARMGSSLYRWATHKGINPYAVQKSIAKKGTRAHAFVKPTYLSMGSKVERDIITGMGRFAMELDNGVV